MKSLLLLVLYLFCMTVTFSQPVDSIYVSKQKEISDFLDLIFINFSDRTTTSLNLDYRSFPTTYTTYAIFGTQVKLIDSPTPNASVLREFEFGDSVWLPNYRDTSITHRTESHVAAIYEFKEMANDYCYFAVTSNGDYGFILQDDLVMQNITEKIDNGKYILYREWREVGLVSSDFSKSIVLPSNDVQFSSEHESLIYSIDNYMESDYKSIYLFYLNTWEKKYITKGFSPILLGQDIVYWTPRKLYDKDSLEQVHLFNLDSKSDRIIFCVPDSLSLWESGGDYRDPGRIESGNSSSKDQFILNLSYRDETLDRYRIIKTLNLNGALINENLKDLCSGCN